MNIRTKILVIEDDQRLAKAIKSVLVLHGYDVCCVRDGALSIQKVSDYNPDLILCAIKMNPIDGCQVYNALKDSSLIDRIPFIFITSKSKLRDIRFVMDLGADDCLVKPIDNETLIRSIEKRLTKFKKLEEIGRREFRKFFNLTPNGTYLFDGHALIEANPALIRILKLGKENINSYSIEDILDSPSYQKIKERIIGCKNGLLNSFSETVSLISREGEKIEGTLYISLYGEYSVNSLLAGLFILNNKKCDDAQVFISDILKILKSENIVATKSLCKRLNDIFEQQNVNTLIQKNDFFSCRENQVLRLSIEGLPTKIIADKLSISKRTVEKHHAQMMEKTNSKNMIEVIIFALRNNLIEF
jgi:DNA-binding NarL/FixJ family response regulator